MSTSSELPPTSALPFLDPTEARHGRGLSYNSLPKQPCLVPPKRPLGLPVRGLPASPAPSGTIGSRSPCLSSPPMSARSFGTFIDTQPSTPAHSPRVGHDWEASTTVLIRPASADSTLASPTEPVWDMVKTGHHTKEPLTPLYYNTRSPLPITLESHAEEDQQSHIIHKAKSSTYIKATATPYVDHMSITALHPLDSPEEDRVRQQEEKAGCGSSAPFGKLASKMKGMLRRRSAPSEKRKERKRREYAEVERLEDLHWTEM